MPTVRRSRLTLLVIASFALALGIPLQAQDPTVTPEASPMVGPSVTMTARADATDPATAIPEMSPTGEVTAEVPAATVDTPTTEPEQPVATAEPTADTAPVPAGPQPNTVQGNVFITETRPFSEELLAQLALPPGFTVSVFASELGNVRMIEVSDTGVIYVSRPGTNDVIALFDQDADGMADIEGFRIVASDIPIAHGLAISGSQLYIAGEKEIYVADILEDGSLSVPEAFSTGLPDGDQHARRTLAFGPDGVLYAHLGSSCNACLESNPENAVIVTVPLDGSARQIVAEGLRNTLGYDWSPETGELWGFDHGSDFRGDDDPPEELNLIQQGNHYGWPFCYGNQQVDRFIPYQTDQLFGMTNEEFCATTAAPALTYQAHSAPIEMKFYNGTQFPEEYVNDAFVTMRGSWNRFPATGYKVVRVQFENGQPVEISDFLSGFLIEDGTAHFARLAGLAFAPDGSMLVADDTNGVIYRVTYTGG